MSRSRSTTVISLIIPSVSSNSMTLARKREKFQLEGTARTGAGVAELEDRRSETEAPSCLAREPVRDLARRLLPFTLTGALCSGIPRRMDQLFPDAFSFFSVPGAAGRCFILCRLQR